MIVSQKNIIIASTIIILLLGSGALFFVRSQNNIAAHNKNTNKAAISPEAPETKKDTVTLPGSSPIPLLAGDYTMPENQWVLVNKDTPLVPADYRPKDLIVPSFATNTSKSTDEQSIREIIKMPSEELFAAADKAGHDIFMASGFRSHELQEAYFDNYVRTSGEAEAIKFSARPGESEHQTGLAFDISSTSRSCYLETCFGESEAGKWLADHAHEYGFILRYPSGKENITKYQYEPWHFRYVGRDLAEAIHTSGLTLEEAYPYIKKANKDETQ